MPINMKFISNKTDLFLVLGVAFLLLGGISMFIFFSPQQINIEEHPAKIIDIELLDAYTQKPIPYANVSIYSSNGELLETVITNSSGKATTNNTYVEEEELVFLINADGYFNMTTINTLSMGNETWTVRLLAYKIPDVERVYGIYWEEDKSVFKDNATNFEYNISIQTKEVNITDGNETKTVNVSYIENSLRIYVAIFFDYPLSSYWLFDEHLEHFIYLNISASLNSTNPNATTYVLPNGTYIENENYTLIAEKISGKEILIGFEFTIGAENITENDTATFTIYPFIMLSVADYDKLDGNTVWTAITLPLTISLRAV